METVWTFAIGAIRVALEIEPEDMDPADSFEFDEDIEAVRSGAVEWFAARVSIYKNGHRIGVDTLGACAYYSIEEFFTAHRDSDPMSRNCSIMRAARGNVTICHYFPDMVCQAVADARKTLSLESAP